MIGMYERVFPLSILASVLAATWRSGQECILKPNNLGSRSNFLSLSSVNLYNAFNISVPQFPSLKMKIMIVPISQDCGEDEISHVKSLEHYLTHYKAKVIFIIIPLTYMNIPF